MKVNRDEIGEIHVTCPVDAQEYVIDNPNLICPACGEVHEPEHYALYFFKDRVVRMAYTNGRKPLGERLTS